MTSLELVEASAGPGVARSRAVRARALYVVISLITSARERSGASLDYKL